jgi:hypothetical protein
VNCEVFLEVSCSKRVDVIIMNYSKMLFYEIVNLRKNGIKHGTALEIRYRNGIDM